jgi:hypothetical protein
MLLSIPLTVLSLIFASAANPLPEDAKIEASQSCGKIATWKCGWCQ